jgi:hypothetical protein
MRGSTAALAAIAVLAIAALIYTWSGDSSDRESRRLSAPTSAERSGQTANRLNDLRQAYDRQRSAGEADDSGSPNGSIKDRAAQAASRPERPAMRREVPTRGAIVADEGLIDDLPYDEDDADEVVELSEAIFNDPDPDERIGAIIMLSGNEHPDAINTFIKAMDDTDAEVRLAAVEALGDYTETIEPSALAPAIDDTDPEVRFEAVSILADFDTPDAYALVRKALDDPDEDVRSLAQGIIEDGEDG